MAASSGSRRYADPLPALLTLLGLGLGLWGLRWALPSEDRLRRVLPPACATPEFREQLTSSWNTLHQTLGHYSLLNPEYFNSGFKESAVAEPGWTTPPPLLMNSTRSFFLRSGHEDEPVIITGLSRIKPHKLELNPRVYFYGTAYMYPLGAWLVIASLFTPLHLVPSLGYYLGNPDQMAWLYLDGRTFSLAIYLAGILATFFIGKRFWNEAAGAWAGLFFALSPGLLIQAHYLKPHLLGAVFVSGAFFFCARILTGAKGRNWLYAGACVGLAAGCAVYQWNSGIVLVFTWLLAWRDGRKPLPQDFARALAVALLAFFITNPFLLYEFKASWESMRVVGGMSQMDPNHLWRFPLFGFTKAVTAPVALLVLWGLLWKRNADDSVTLLATSVFAFYLATTFVMQASHKLDSIRQFPVAFLGFLLAGRRLAATREWLRYAGAAAACWALLNCAVLDRNLQLDSPGRSTKDEAGAWIEANLPQGSEIGFVRLPQPSNSPYFQWNKYRLKFYEEDAFVKTAAADLPRHLVLTYSTEVWASIKPEVDAHYELLVEFEPFTLLGIMPPLGESFANPLIEIYRRIG